MGVIDSERKIRRGHGSDERPVARDLWAADSRPDHVALRETGNHDPDYHQVDYRRYLDRDHAALEHRHIWLKSWVGACREEDLPAVGDRLPFQLGPTSFIVVRSGEDEFRAFYNSCLHRGTELCSKPESGDTIRCPFHAWEWKIDGSLKAIPSHWDFKAVTPRNARLREVKVGRWGGFVYINADLDAAPFEQALGPIPRHFADFAPERRYTHAHFRKLIRANWKAVQEAFMESYHVMATHPMAVDYNGDSQSQYDIWEDGIAHVGRQITPSAVPSMHAGPHATMRSAAEAFAYYIQATYFPDAPLPVIDPDRPARPQVAAWYRDLETARLGRPCTLPDALLMDSPLYFLFPHTTFWLTESLPYYYRFLPHETDPEMSYFEVRMLRHHPEGTPRPAPSPRIEIGADEKIADHAQAFGFLSIVFDQDMDNVPLVQRGMRSADPARAYAVLGDYQEFIVQHWHAIMDRMIADGEAAART